ncbi:MAG: hypothetical protein ACKVX7_06525 [Planctomycetota bacterium]
MNRTMLLIVGLVCVAVIGWSAAGLTWAQGGGKKPAEWKDIEAGTVPSEYGDLVGVTGVTGNLVLVFKKSNNDIGILTLSGTKVNAQMTMIKRQ